jgi:JmjC domain, hydroxylase/C5HC2 zinc finger
MYSINYHHRGAPKQWYGVPGSKEASDGLEKVFKSYLSMKMREVPDLLHHITTMFSPRLLQNANVPVCRLLQYEGEFIVTFPRAFHGGFSYGPNAGEAVNFATHDWIYYGADANERYRSFARPAVFSHDRLTFTIAHHLNMQKAYSTCKLLLEELERVVQEEFKRRAELSKAGVRDVSHLIKLPKNRLDQLDERSAAYDDKRLCHACRHICFFSAVACECSQSKVSCLRHSHYMCRCPTHKKYFMIWSPNEELKSTVERVRAHCEVLGKQVMNVEATASAAAAAKLLLEATPLPEFAVGSKEDQELHKDDEISTGLFLGPTYQPIRSIANKSLEAAQKEPAMAKAMSHVVSDASSTRASPLSPEQSVSPNFVSAVGAAALDDDDDDDDEVEVLGVVAGRGPDC